MRTCFIIMPFRDKYEKIFNLVSSVAKEYNIELIRADKNFLSCPVMEEIIRCISTSDYIISIIGDDHNANVFYELGISHSKKPFTKVLIIKDVKEEYAFDIQHIKQFTFSPKRLNGIEKDIRRFFDYNESEESLENALNAMTFFQDNKSMCAELIDYLKNNCGNLCHDISKILLSIESASVMIIPIISTLKDRVIAETITGENLLGQALIRLYAEVIVKTFHKYDHSNDVQDMFHNLAIFDSYKYIFATTLINSNAYLKISVQWLISYFAKNDVHRIDITRHKIEEFLVLSKSEEVNDALKEALGHESPHVREYCAEIIREKKLLSARSSLLRQLVQEENIYSARSIIDALVAIDCDRKAYHEEDLQNIKEYASKIIYDENSFIKKHFDVADAVLSNKSCG